MAKPVPTELENYLSKFTPDVRERIERIRRLGITTWPAASEEFRYGSPAFSDEKVLIVYAAHKNHIGFYPTPEVLEVLESEIDEYKHSKGSIQFPHDKPLPLALIKKMMKLRDKQHCSKKVGK